ncbi:MAG: Pvc16 family protein [Candidatus Korobacteraceae bacterium]
MSSNTAIKDVTRGLQMLLLSQISAISKAAQVSLLPPGQALPSGLGVNLYLYRIMENVFTKNQPWPGDKTTPPSNTPPLGLELSYLLTPFAPAPDPATTDGDDAHTMLGAAMLAFHQYPILNDVHVAGFDADTALPVAILNSFEQVKIRLAVTSLEELSKIWATINQPYRLSVAYDVSLIELVPSTPPPVSGSQVLSTGLSVVLYQAPRLDALSPAAGPLAHVAAGAIVANILTITGSGLSLRGRTPVVLIGGQDVAINGAPAPTDTSLAVTLPITLDAGPNQDVQVSLQGKASTSLTFTVTPWLTSLTPIRTTLDGQGGPPAPTLVLSGNGFTTTPQAVRFDGPGGTTSVTSFVGAATDSQTTITIPSALQNGLYQVRLVLADNSVSNARTLQVIPLIASPIALAVITVAGQQVHQLTINGARLNGADVRVLIDGIAYQAGANANAAQLVFALGRLLDSGSHTVAVVVDGSQSHDLALGVP